MSIIAQEEDFSFGWRGAGRRSKWDTNVWESWIISCKLNHVDLEQFFCFNQFLFSNFLKKKKKEWEEEEGEGAGEGEEGGEEEEYESQSQYNLTRKWSE